MDMQVSSDQTLLALQSTWKRNEKIKLFMIMHMAWRREKLGVGGSLTQSLDARGPFFYILLLSGDGDQPSTMTKVHRDTASLALAVHLLTPTWLSTLRDAFPDSEDTGVEGGGEAGTLGC